MRFHCLNNRGDKPFNSNSTEFHRLRRLRLSPSGDTQPLNKALGDHRGDHQKAVKRLLHGSTVLLHGVIARFPIKKGYSVIIQILMI
jgi:hypothetical protein